VTHIADTGTGWTSLLGAGAPSDTPNRWPQWISTNLTPTRMGEIFRQADQGYYTYLGELLQELITRDPRLQTFYGVRVSSLVKRPLRCVPNESDPDPERAKDVAAYGQQVLQRLKTSRYERDGDSAQYKVIQDQGIRGVVRGGAKSFWYGVQAGWKHWETLPGEPTPQPTLLEFFDERRFYIGKQQELYVQTANSGSMGVPLSTWHSSLRFEIRNTRYTHRLARCGLGFAAVFPWWLSFEGAKHMTAYMGRWGVPNIFGKLPEKPPPGLTAEVINRLKTIFRDYQSDMAGLLPPGVEPFIGQLGGGGTELFKLIDAMTCDWIQFLLLGQTGTSSGNGGSYAKAVVNDETKDDLTDDDCGLSGEWLEELLRYPIELRFGYGTPGCKVEHELSDGARLKKIQFLKAASDAGAPVSIRKLLASASLPEPSEDGEPLLGGMVWSLKDRRPVTLAEWTAAKETEVPADPEVAAQKKALEEEELAYKRELRQIDLAKQRALVWQSGVYPLNGSVNNGWNVDHAKAAEQIMLPLAPNKEPYTKPEIPVPGGDAPQENQ
jgi:hypothetical protein